MFGTTLILTAFTFATPQDTDAARKAIEIVRGVKGSLTFDEKAAGKPVVGLNL